MKSTHSACLHKKLADLIPDNRNANKGTERGNALIQESLQQYGAGRSILLDKHGAIIAGNKTVENCGAIGLDDVIVVQSDGTKLVAVQRTDLDLKDARTRQFAIADNRAGQVSLDWDVDVLKELALDGVDLAPFWSADELEKMWPQVVELQTDEDAVPPVPEEPKSKLGDLYVLGEHRLLCGSCSELEDVNRLLEDVTPDLTLTDPPYGLADTVSDKNNYDVYVDSKQNLIDLIGSFLPIALQRTKVIVLTPGNRNQRLYPEPTWMMAWFTPAGVGRGPWGFCCWQPILCYGKDPKLAHGKGSHPDAIVHTESAEKVDHPCSKPVKFWQWLLERVSEMHANVYDPFGGSGTGMIACEKTRRRCFMMELSPAYCDVIVKRWENATGKKAVLDGQA